ncbi:hypothetical protein BUALT_Bualt17G0084800 [Buddleja alternifolia]|uniref:Transmembrane protein n=1 Tax=Buddleja alternifolia TaxID=168488 RepID=A0AAV6WFG1_9LAMI|nr:hypothetical protein BUALT_Bualt17G0084800 [Buddleja alternifolia]
MGMGNEEVTKFVVEKLKQALLTVGKFGSEAFTWFNKVFSAKTRGEKINHWFLVARSYLIAAAVIWFLRRCCGGGRGKMMEAPGRNYRMRRNEFEMMKFVVEKLKQALLAVENFGGEAMAWFGNVFPQALLAVENFGGEAMAWFDKVFPPETRGEKINHWFHVALPFLIAAAVLTVVFYFCRYCCRCCCGSFSHGGFLLLPMLQSVLPWIMGEDDESPREEHHPRGYFQNLRAHPGDHLC